MAPRKPAENASPQQQPLTPTVVPSAPVTPSTQASEALMASLDQPLSIERIVQRVKFIHEVMGRVMREGEHYGVIPGTDKKCLPCDGTGKMKDGKPCDRCGGRGKTGKPTLYKPGAEVLCLTFGLDVQYEQEYVDLGNGHREVKTYATVYSAATGRRLGAGVGTCSTMESKYRYRGSIKEDTGREVPREYWDIRGSDPTKAQQLLGGPGYVTSKDENNRWMIFRKGEKAENTDIADTYNTVAKISKKRSFADASLSVTGASELFTQDLEDMIENESAANAARPTGQTPRPPATTPPSTPPPQQAQPAAAQPKTNGTPSSTPQGTAAAPQALAGGTLEATVAYIVKASDELKDGLNAVEAWCKKVLGHSWMVARKVPEEAMRVKAAIDAGELGEWAAKPGAQPAAQSASTPPATSTACKCGAAITGKFCNECGAATSIGAADPFKNGAA